MKTPMNVMRHSVLLLPLALACLLVRADDSATTAGATNVRLNQRSATAPYDRQNVDIRGLDNPGKALGFDANGILTAIVGGAVATDSIFDAKGDLSVGTGADAAARLAAGTNGHVLTTDSATATGLKWAAGGDALLAGNNTFTGANIFTQNVRIGAPAGASASSLMPFYGSLAFGTDGQTYTQSHTTIGKSQGQGISLAQYSALFWTNSADGSKGLSSPTLANSWGRLWVPNLGIYEFGVPGSNPGPSSTLKGADAQQGIDANAVGGDMVVAAGKGTGTGAGGSLFQKTAIAGTSALLSGPLVTREFVYGGEKAMTAGTATPLVTFSLISSTYCGGSLTATTHADDGTDFQATTEFLTFSAVNKAGTVTAVIQAAPATSTTAASAGTLTTAWTITTSANFIFIRNNAVSSLAETTLNVSYRLTLNTNDLMNVSP